MTAQHWRGWHRRHHRPHRHDCHLYFTVIKEPFQMGNQNMTASETVLAVLGAEFDGPDATGNVVTGDPVVSASGWSVDQPNFAITASADGLSAAIVTAAGATGVVGNVSVTAVTQSGLSIPFTGTVTVVEGAPESGELDFSIEAAPAPTPDPSAV